MKRLIFTPFVVSIALMAEAQLPVLDTTYSTTEQTDTAYIEGAHTTRRERPRLSSDTLKQKRGKALAEKQAHPHNHIRKHKITYVTAIPVDPAAWSYYANRHSARGDTSKRLVKAKKIQY